MDSHSAAPRDQLQILSQYLSQEYWLETDLCTCFDGGGNRSTWRRRTCKLHIERSCYSRELNPGPSFLYEATVLTTKPLYIVSYFYRVVTPSLPTEKQQRAVVEKWENHSETLLPVVLYMMFLCSFSNIRLLEKYQTPVWQHVLLETWKRMSFLLLVLRDSLHGASFCIKQNTFVYSSAFRKLLKPGSRV